MTLCRCTPSRQCLNCDRAAFLKAKLARDDHREAIAIGRARYERNSREVRGRA